MSKTAHKTARSPAAEVLGPANVSLLEVIDHVLNQGVVLSGDVMLSVADVDLIYVRLAALICSADRVLSPGPLPATHRRRRR